MLRACIAIVAVVVVLSGCGEDLTPPALTPPVPVDMDGDWSGMVTVYAVNQDGSKTKMYEYPTVISLEQSGNWAVARGICPAETLEVRRIFINSTFLYWEGSEWCSKPPAPITYLSITHIHIEPRPDGSGTGYVEGAIAVDAQRTIKTMWAELRLVRGLLHAEQ